MKRIRDFLSRPTVTIALFALALVLLGGSTLGGARAALESAGVLLYGGVAGDADTAVNAFLAGTLGYDPDVHCHHHDASQAHDCGGCHDRERGCHGCGHVGS